MQFTALLISALVGVSLIVQVGANATMRAHLGSAMGAALVNFVVGIVALIVVALVGREPLPTAGQFAAAPWWAWLGGLIGAAYVASSTVLGPALGAAAFTAIVVAGQMLGSLVVDNYGLMGFAQRSADPLRILGAVLVVAGVVLLSRR